VTGAASTVGAFAGAQARVESVLTPRRARVVLLAYALAFTIFAGFHLVSVLPNQETLMSTRDQGISASIAVMHDGGPPLLGAKTRYGAPGVDPRTAYYPVGTGDDQGLYLYLPVLSVVTGERDPHVLLKWLFIGCFTLLFAAYPLLIYESMGSMLAAVAAPFFVLYSFAFLQNTDLYWIVGWCILLGLPLVFAALAREWSRLSVALLIVAGLVASFSTSIRIHSGLPITIAAVVVALVRAPTWRWKIGVGAAVLAASFSIDVAVFDAVRFARDEIIGVPFRNEFPSEHPTWHNAYIGLGYLPNKYGITWNDSVSVAAVRRVDPNAGFLTPKYEHILRHLWFKLLWKDPSFVLGTLWTKFGVCVRDAIHRFGWAWPFLLAATLLVGSRRRNMRWFVALTLPALLIDVVPPVVTIPYLQYETGWLTAVGFLWMLLILWGFASVGDVLHWIRDDRPSLRRLVPSRREAAVAVAACAAVVALTRPALVHARAALARAYYEQAAQTLATVPVTGTVVRDWPFDNALAEGWSQFQYADTGRSGNGLEVTTRPSVAEYQLWSSDIPLRKGSYAVVVRGAVRSGGMTVGALDAAAQQWLAQTSYWSGERFGRGVMVTRFTLGARTSVQVVLANWASKPRSSRWTVRDVRLLRVK
jgi:hypothetical protein